MNRVATVGLSLALLIGAPVGALAQEETPRAEESVEQRVQRLVGQLGASSFEERVAAQRELESIGRPALGALESATRSDDPEVAARAREAIGRITGQEPHGQPDSQQDELREGTPTPPPLPQMPDMDEMMKDLERQLQEQLPGEFGQLFREFFRGFGERDGTRERGDNGRARVRVWSFGNGGGQSSETSTAHGLAVGTPSAALRAQLGLERSDGLVVNEVLPGGWAEQAGVKQYDVLVAADGRALRRLADLEALAAQGGKLELYRRAKLETLEVPALAESTRPGPRLRPVPPQPKKGDEKKERSF